MGEYRRVGIAMDFSSSSKSALQWALSNVGRHQDRLDVIVVNKKQNEVGEMHLWEHTGSPSIPLSDFVLPNICQKYGVEPDTELFSLLEEETKKLKLIVEFKVYWGDAKDKICDSVAELHLDCIVMGNRGHGTLKRAILGSVSNYVVNNAPCPVTVVKLMENIQHPHSSS